MIFAEGNNRESIKIRRVEIPLYDPINQNSTGVGNYYFPEIPELNNKEIVGIQALTANPTFGTSKIIENFNPNFITPNTPNGFAYNADFATYAVSTLTLTGTDNIKVIDSFPVMQLIGGPWDTFPAAKLKIFPFSVKINIRNSFISVYQVTVVQKLIANFNFYYRD
jgi:hypothetical protein